MKEKTYSFKFNNIKAMRYLPLSFAGIPFISLLDTDVTVALFMIIILLPMLVAFIIIFKKMSVRDEIIIGDSYLDSAYYGRINFDEIKKVSSSDMWGKPNLIIKLQNGRKCRWIPVSTLKSNKNVQALQAFIDCFSDALHKKTTSPAQTIITDNAEEKIDLKEELESVKTKNSKVSKFAVPATLGLALIGFARTCIMPKIEQHKNDEVRNMFQEGLEENNDLKNEAVDLIKKYQHKYGPFYLFTNDTSAVIKYIPRIEPPDGYEGPLSYEFENDSLRKLLAHPDSMRWNMTIATKDGNSCMLKKGLLNTDDSTDTYVYLTENIPDIKVTNEISGLNDTVSEPDSLPAQLSFAVPLYKNKSIGENLNDGVIGYDMFMSLITHHSATAKLYMAAQDKEGKMDDVLFKKVVAELKKTLGRQGADTTVFFIKEFN
ncbi:MAG TPA: hypothetical protein VGB84_00120 [Arachidicoccus sp.]